MAGFKNAPSITEFAVGMRVKNVLCDVWHTIIGIAPTGDAIASNGGCIGSLSLSDWKLDLDSIWVGRLYTDTPPSVQPKMVVEVRAVAPDGWIIYRHANILRQLQPEHFRNSFTPLPVPAPEPPVQVGDIVSINRREGCCPYTGTVMQCVRVAGDPHYKLRLHSGKDLFEIDIPLTDTINKLVPEAKP